MVLAPAPSGNGSGGGNGRQPHRNSRTSRSSAPGQGILPTEHFGDVPGPPDSSKFRLGFVNPGGFPVSAQQGQSKDREIFEFLSKYEFDSAGMPEMNNKWDECRMEDRLETRTEGWFESRSIRTSYFRHEPTSERWQPGGTSVWSINSFSHRIKSQGEDPSGLGRWSWVSYQGRGDSAMRVVCAYRPVKNLSGPRTVWQQQKSFLRSKDDDRDPRVAFLEDLAAEIEQWVSAGDNIVLGLDANEHLSGTDNVTKCFEAAGLFNAITSRHGFGTPNTYNRGSDTIDGLFVTPALLGQRCGFLPFESFDHRGFWIDIPYAVALGHALPPLVRPPMRRLRTKDPRVVLKYLTRLKATVADLQILQRARDLYDELTSALESGPDLCELTLDQQRRYDKLEEDRVLAMKDAEKHCRHLFAGKIPWSPELANAYDRVTYWKKSIHKRQGRKVKTRFLRRLRRRAGIVYDPTMSLSQLQDQLEMAYSALRKIKATASEKRATYQEGLIAAYEAQGHPNAAHHVEQMMKREKIRKDNAAIRRATGKEQKGAVAFVLETDGDGATHERRGKEEIEQACLRENDRRFRLASHTSMLQEPQINHFGPFGTTPAADAVLAGTWSPPPGTSPYLTELLPYLVQPEAVREAPIDISLDVEAHRKRWKKAKESTSSSPLAGLHFGHFIAGAQDEDIGELHAIMDDIPYRTGYVPSRWKQGINCMLGKGKGFHVKNLRTILLYEPDFNFTNGRTGRLAMENAEKHGTIPPEQYGSRKNHSAIDQALNKVLMHDLLRLLRQPGAHMVGDLAKCYDRIEHSFAGLSLRCQGLPKGPVEAMFGTIQELVHHVRTIYGDSSISFSSDNPLYAVPIQGVGQGNAAGPQIWALVSAPCLKLLYHKGHRCFFRCALSGEEVSFVGYAFVDDFDQVTTAEEISAPAFIAAEKMQAAVRDWAGSVEVTGGALEPSKSYWYLIDFEWSNGSYKYKSIASAPASITLADESGNSITLQRLEPHDARRTLGLYQAPDGNMVIQHQQMLKQASKWSTHIRTSALPRHLVWQSLHTSVLMSLKYPLPATTLSHTQCYDIMKPLLSAGLSRSGLPRTMARKVVFGPPKYQGIGIPHLFVEQGLAHIQKVLRFCRSRAITGKLLRATLQQHTMELGLPDSMFTYKYADFGCLASPSWLSDLWKFLDHFHLELDVDSPLLAKCTDDDAFLMLQFFLHGYRGGELSLLNKCRVYVQAITLGDLTTANGKFFVYEAWNGIPLGRRSSLRWPNQGPLPDSAWTFWQKALHKVFGGSCEQPLSAPLGPWNKEIIDSWTQWYDPTSNRIYERNGDQWYFYPSASVRASRRQGLGKFLSTERGSDPLPITAVPASFNYMYRGTGSQRRRSTYIILQSVDHRQYAPTQPIPDSFPTLEEQIQSLPAGENWAILNASGVNLTTLAGDIERGSAIAVSDGSFKDQFGTAAWRIEGQDADPVSKAWLEGSCVIPGLPLDQSAYRSELGGLYGIVTMAKLFCKVASITSGHITIACDGDSALWKAIDEKGEVDPTDQQFDMIAAIRQQLQATPIAWTSKQVAGHQDKNPYNVLDRFATINCEMDALAKQHWTQNHRAGNHYSGEIYGSPWTLRVAGQPIHFNFKKAILEHTLGQDLQTFWDAKGRFGTAGSKAVDWTAVEDLMAVLPRAREHWLVKQAARVSATGRNMVRRKHQQSSQCPRCFSEDEDNAHILRCQAPPVQILWQSKMQDLELWLLSKGTSPGISSALPQGLLSWYNSEPPDLPIDLAPSAREAFLDQSAIGWQCLLEGCPSKKWAESQEQYFTSHGSTRTGRSWIRVVLRHLIEFSFSLWEHRNEAAHAKETSIVDRELNQRIREEFALGFHGMRDRGFHRNSLRNLLQASVGIRKAWLHNVQVERDALERKRAQFIAPQWVYNTLGYINWTRKGRPSVPTEEIMQAYPSLRQDGTGEDRTDTLDPG